MKFSKLVLPLALAVSSAYASAGYQLRVLARDNNGGYSLHKSGCYCRKSECERIGRSRGTYTCTYSYECGTC